MPLHTASLPNVWSNAYRLCTHRLSSQVPERTDGGVDLLVLDKVSLAVVLNVVLHHVLDLVHAVRRDGIVVLCEGSGGSAVRLCICTHQHTETLLKRVSVELVALKGVLE